MKDVQPKWVFDDSPISDPLGYGERASRFMNALKHPKGGSGIAPFWDRIIRRIYGPRDAAGNRLVRTAFIMIGRGARKTTIGAGLGLMHTISKYERTKGGSCILAASAEDQADLAFEEAVGFAKANPEIQKAIHVVPSELLVEHLKSGSELRAIPAEGDAQQGKTPYFVLVDELHVWKNRRLWRALKTGLLKVPNSLLVIITTAGAGQENVAYEEYRYARSVAAGEIENPAYLPIIFEPQEGADWRSETTWHRANPGLRYGFPDIVGMRQAALEAEAKPADREDFKRFNLNFWAEASAAPFVEMDLYDACAGEVDLEYLKDKPCWLGVDLSSNRDLTAIVACWKDDDRFIVNPWVFIPEEAIGKRTELEQIPYRTWHEQGHIIGTEGNVTDRAAVEDKIREICDEFDVREIAIDPWDAAQLIASLHGDGLPAVEMRQGRITMSPAISELERVIVSNTLRHSGHPLMRWCFSNIFVEKDKAGNRTFTKSKSKDKIDAAVACAMAVGRAALGESNTSIYADTTARPTGLLVI